MPPPPHFRTLPALPAVALAKEGYPKGGTFGIRLNMERELFIKARIKIFETARNRFGFPTNKFRVSIWLKRKMNQTFTEFRFTAPIEKTEAVYECEIVIGNNPYFDSIQKGDEFFIGGFDEPVGEGIVLERLASRSNSIWNSD